MKLPPCVSFSLVQTSYSFSKSDVCKRIATIASSLAIAIGLLTGISAQGQSPTPIATSTVLTITAGGSSATTVSSFKAVTLTATVTAGGAAVTSGTVNFCVSTQPSCYGAADVGTVQLTSAGTASLSLRPAQGSHSYKAIFLGTTSSAPSSSAVQTLTVNKPSAPQLPTQTAITSTGTTGNYTLSATTIGNGNEPLSGNLNFVDLTHGNSILATQPLTAPVTSTGFMFVPAQTSPQTGKPLATGDFNGDGILDLVTQVAGGVALQLGNGDLTFKSGTVLPGGGPATIGDFNADGKLDLAITSTSGVQIYLGDGTGKLTALPPSLTLPVTNPPAVPIAMSTADFNRDGILDLVVQDPVNTSVFFGAGDGTFTTGPTILVGGSANQGSAQGTSMVTGDFNADGIPDIAVAWNAMNGQTQFAVTFLFSDGTGNFTSTDVFPNLDAGNSPGGSGGATDPTTSSPGPMYLTALDINHDGRQDVMAGWSFVACCPEGQNSGTINFINNGDGTITASGLGGGFDYGAPGIPVGITVVDLVGDGSDTVALERGQGSENPGSGEPGEPPSITYTANAPAFSLPANFSGGFVPGDYDGDGIDEIAVTVNSAASIVGFQVTATASASNIAVVPAGSGAHQVDASYAGDSVHTSSASTSVSLDSGIGAPTIHLSALSTVAYGATIQITATLTSTGPTPTGTLTFLNGSSTIGTATLTSGVATLNISTLPLGKNSITATYPGDTNNAAAATSPAITITVTQAAPTLTLTASPASPTYGAAVTLTAKLGGVSTIPTGSITFKSQSGTLGTQTLDKTGTAALTVPSLAAGKYSVTASFAGDTDDSAVTSQALTLPVAPAVAATSALATIYSGQADAIAITLSVGTNATAPTGTITLSGIGFTSASTALTAGAATITIPANTLAAGNVTLTATYSGDANYPTSTGQIVVAVATAPPPGFTVSAPALSIAPGASTNNTVAVTLTPVTGFTGSVALSAQVTASPAAATDLPTVSFGSTSTVAITGSSPMTATLTINTSPQVTSRNNAQPIPGSGGLFAAGGAVLACGFLCGIPGRRLHRLLRQSHGRWLILALAFALLSLGLSSCGGHTKKITDPGTTPGSYTITVTATSGTISSTGTIALTVQ
jgi:hypothetical protein